MSAAARRRSLLCLAVFVAGVAQAVFADALRLRGARPDLLTATAIMCALFCDANEGAGVGFLAGLLLAALTGPPRGGFGSLIVSRTLVGLAVGWLEERIERDNPLLAVLLVTAGSAAADSLFFLFAPQHAIAHWARGLLLTTLYNAVLAYPLYFVIRRLVGERKPEGG